MMRTTLNPLTLLGLAASCSLLLAPSLVDSKSILGIDLGSLYMKVALVRRNSPLEIVTNMHSKRKTEQMVLFDAGSRFYGADASSLLARKPHLTPTQMSVLLGRDAAHPSVAALGERHYQFTPERNETRTGTKIVVDGESYTPEELVAMVLTHAREIAAVYGESTTPPGECVLTVPSFYTQHERRALLDAAELAGLNVLALINENTAAALHFGIDRIDETPVTYLFYNMGANSLQVSVVRYLSYPHKKSKYDKAKNVGAFEVLSSAWDATLGGASFDARLVNFMADEFNAAWNEKRGTTTNDVRDFPKSMAKLMIQANKVKEVLSANSEIPVFIDALQDDVNYQTHISRAKFEGICHDLLERASAPIGRALKMANVTLDDLDAVELIGGGMRVPKVQEAVALALSGGTKNIELGMHLNSDESMALGAAFHGANVSAAFKVRHVGMADVNPFPVAVDMTDLDVGKEQKKFGGGLFGIGKKKEEAKVVDDVWAKHATIFKQGSRLGVKKTIAFSHEKDVHVAVNYEESEMLPIGTSLSIEQYDVSGIAEFATEMAKKSLGVPKVSLQFELDTSGLTRLIKAEAVVEETVIVDEEVEVEDEEAKISDAATEDVAADDAKVEDEAKVGAKEKEDADTIEKEGEVKSETKKEAADDKAGEKNTPATKNAKKMKTITVQKEKKKRHVRNLKVHSYHVGSIRPYTSELMAESKAKLDMLAQADKERTMLEEAKNDYEAYIYYIRNKLVDYEEEIAKVTSEEQREALRRSAEDAEEWLFDDGYTADLKTFQEKHAELSTPAEKAFFRMSELTARPKAIEALSKRLAEAEDLMQIWEKTMAHITEEERTEVLDKVGVVRSWIEEKVGEQDKADATADPVFTSQEVPGQAKKIDAIIERLRKKPKPKPIKKNETESPEKNATEMPEDADESSETTESDREKTEDQVPKAEEVKEFDGKKTEDEVSKAEEVKDDTEEVVEDEL